MSAPTITITISGPAGAGKSLLSAAIADVLLLLGVPSVAHDESGIEWRGRLHQLAAVDVRIVTTNEGA